MHHYQSLILNIYKNIDASLENTSCNFDRYFYVRQFVHIFFLYLFPYLLLVLANNLIFKSVIKQKSSLLMSIIFVFLWRSFHSQQPQKLTCWVTWTNTRRNQCSLSAIAASSRRWHFLPSTSCPHVTFCGSTRSGPFTVLFSTTKSWIGD